MAAAVMPDRHPGWLFADPAHWADMSDWHVRVAELRRDHPVLEVNRAGFERFWALTRHADVLAVSRANDQWQNTPKSVLSAEPDWREMTAPGLMPGSLVQLDGKKHRDHRQVTDDWFKPAVVGQRQPRIEELADRYIERMRELGGQCDFCRTRRSSTAARSARNRTGVPPGISSGSRTWSRQTVWVRNEPRSR